jgi:spore germination protein KB
VGLAYLLFFIHINSIIIREFGDFLVSAFLPETPILVFNIMVLTLAAMAVRGGIEVIARVNQFVFPQFFLVLAALVFLTIEEWEFGNLLPLLEYGIKPVLAGSVTPSAWRGEVVVILMFLPYLNKPAEAAKSVAAAVLIIAVFLTLPILAGVLVFGSEQEAHFVFPTLELARYVNVGDFLQRLEAIIIIVWVAGITVKVAVFYLASVLSASHLVGLSDYRPLVYPVGIITLVYSIVLFDNSRELVKFLAEYVPYYAYIFELGIPMVLLVIAIIRRKGGKLSGQTKFFQKDRGS